MSTASYPHISIDTDGTARIGQARYEVPHVVAKHYYYGWSAEERLRQHSDPRPAEVHVALTCFYDHLDELLTDMGETRITAETFRASVNFFRDVLLRRR